MANTIKKICLYNPIHLLATTFGVGLLPFAPGTWGTLAAIPFYLLMRNLSLFHYCGLIVLLFGIGVWVSEIVTRDVGVYDYPQIVFDETVGFLATMIALPHHWLWIVLGFLLFRFFDILKPWPINWVDHEVRNGLGVMLDDLLAAIYASIVLRIILLVALHMHLLLSFIQP